MCNHLTILASTGGYRAVGQCEHGALHISWDISTIRLRPNDFWVLTQFLDRWGARSETPTVCEGWCQLSRDQYGAARLWVGQAGFALGPDDIDEFVLMMTQAAAVLRSAAQRTLASQSALRCPVLMIDTGGLAQN